MAGEIRITGSINLKENLYAVGYFDEIGYIIDKITNPKSNFQYTQQYKTLASYNDTELSIYIDNEKEKLYLIERLLKKYNINVPIIDPLTSNIVNCNKANDLKTLKKLLKIK